ncbi:MAG: HlyD family type I secretion periplasmic adaptor subunit [Desulfuromonas sp.]|mgnify:CR=1 FL=1|nr:MAG: HlyD family type I secretion periplasmic adaptor subunit [Desulfuromonas sp.]
MINRWLGRILAALIPDRSQNEPAWELDADDAGIDQEPLRARTLLYLGGLVLVVLLLWAGFTQIEEVNRGEGRVIPSRQVQIIQAVDGGVVSEIAVQEGETVAFGQPLVRIDPTRFVSSLRENRSQYIALQIKAERLKALSENRAFVPPEGLGDEATDILEREGTLYESSRKELEAQLGGAQQIRLQRSEDLHETDAHLNQLDERLVLLEKELAVTRPLIGTGAVSEVELLRLERDVIRVKGERDQALARLDRVHAEITEADRKIQEVELSFYNGVRRELSEVLSRIARLTEEEASLSDRVKHAVVKSPVRGTVKRLYVNTLGAVVAPGKEIVEIVPLDDTLVLEVKISPRDIAFLRPGLTAKVKFTAYDYAIYGSLDAVLEQIGADTVVDQQGQAFYMVRVRTLQPDLGQDLPVISGMVAQVDIVTGKKSLLTYLLKPILRAKATAFRER